MPAATQTVLRIDGEEIAVTNPDKLLWPQEGIRKLDFIERLLPLAPYLLRYCRDRYLTTIRYPDGVGGKSFYQKNCPQPAPPFVRTADTGGIDYVNLDSLPVLLWLANLACVEYHPSLNRIGDTLPEEWLIDIDPTLEEEPRIFEAARIVGELLDSLRIRSVAKTSGATGVQIYVPIRRGYTFEQLRRIGEFISRYLTQKHPSLFTIERLKKNRGTLIYLDYLQHWHGKTLSAPYTPRAKPGAPVSTPLLWSELEQRDLRPRDFNLFTIGERLKKHGDLIEQVPPQSLASVLAFIESL